MLRALGRFRCRPQVVERREERMVTLPTPTWNQLVDWLRGLDLSRAGWPIKVSGPRASGPHPSESDEAAHVQASCRREPGRSSDAHRHAGESDGSRPGERTRNLTMKDVKAKGVLGPFWRRSDNRIPVNRSIQLERFACMRLQDRGVMATKDPIGGLRRSGFVQMVSSDVLRNGARTSYPLLAAHPRRPPRGGGGARVSSDVRVARRSQANRALGTPCNG